MMSSCGSVRPTPSRSGFSLTGFAGMGRVKQLSCRHPAVEGIPGEKEKGYEYAIGNAVRY